MIQIQSMRKEYSLRAIKNRTLRMIFEPKRDEVMGGLQKTAQ
jgi:hypothetical protein